MKNYYEDNANKNKPTGHKGLVKKLGVAAGGLTLAAAVTMPSNTPNVNKLPKEDVVVTGNSPYNSIDGMIGAVDGNNLSGPVFNDIQGYLLKQNHNSATIHAGQVFKVPIVEQSHPPGNNSDSKK